MHGFSYLGETLDLLEDSVHSKGGAMAGLLVAGYVELVVLAVARCIGVLVHVARTGIAGRAVPVAAAVVSWVRFLVAVSCEGIAVAVLGPLADPVDLARRHFPLVHVLLHHRPVLAQRHEWRALVRRSGDEVELHAELLLDAAPAVHDVAVRAADERLVATLGALLAVAGLVVGEERSLEHVLARFEGLVRALGVRTVLPDRIQSECTAQCRLRRLGLAVVRVLGLVVRLVLVDECGSAVQPRRRPLRVWLQLRQVRQDGLA